MRRLKMEIEKEIKVLITEYQYNEIIKKIYLPKQVQQINFYYDDLERTMIFSGKTVRIRADKDKMYLQLKRHLEKREDVIMSQEFCKKIGTIPYCICEEELYKLTGEKYPDVYLLGFLFTERSIYTVDSQIQIMLDKNVYLGCLDYELEIEYTCEDNKLDKVFSILNEFNIKILSKGKISSKSIRFVKKYYDSII